MDLISIPDGPHALTAEWLTAALAGSDGMRGDAVASFTATMLGEGRGFTGRVARLELHYRDDGGRLPRSLIAKFPPSDPHARAALNFYGIYEREVRFYREAAPRLSLRVPSLYGSALDPATGQSVLLLEDLAPARSFDIAEGVSPSDAELIVRQMARFHAAWWESPELPSFEWLAPFDVMAEAREARYRDAFGAFLERAGHRAPPALIDLGERLKGRVAAVKARLAGSPVTFVHGDFHPNNLFLIEHSRTLAVVDWQVCCRGRAAWDLMYFLATALRLADRRAHEIDLIHAYHAQLRADGVTGYSVAQCIEDADLAALDLLYYLVMIVALLDFSTNEHARAFEAVCLERIGGAVLDHQAAVRFP